MDPALYWLWLAHGVGPAWKDAGRCLRQFPDPARLWAAAQEGALPDWFTPRAKERLCAAAPWTFEPLLDNCALRRIWVLTPEDPAYPRRFLDLPDAPLVLYATGDTACLNGRAYVGVVGTRRPTAYGRQAAADLSAALAKRGVVIVSGLADGLDSVGQRAAVQAGAPTVAFLGTAIDKTYPAANLPLRQALEQQGGCSLSEYAPQSAALSQKAAFLDRNRLIAGLAQVLCVAEARERSGTLNTVAHAERYGRPVLAVPGSIYSPASGGTNRLLHDGRAAALCGPADVLALLDPAAGTAAPAVPGSAAAVPAAADAPAPADPAWPGDDALPPDAADDLPPDISDDARTLYAVLGPVPQQADELCRITGLPAARATPALLELEFRGLALVEPGRRYLLAR